MYKGLFGSITTFLDLQLRFYQSEEYVLKKVNNPKGVGNNSKSSGTSIQEKSSEKHIFCDLSLIFARRW